MFKYFKKQRSRRTHDDDSYSMVPSDVPNNVKRKSLRSTSNFCDEYFLDDDMKAFDSETCGVSVSSACTDQDIFNCQSRISMSLPAIINDQNCFGYFVQYLEAKNALPLIRFYLDIDNFKTAALAQLETHRQSQFKHDISTVMSGKCNGNSDNDETNSVPELKTLCDQSMRKPLTDDEKSQIYAETNKQITKCKAIKLKSCSELSLCSKSTTATEHEHIMKKGFMGSSSIKDAISIYQKYLNANSQQFVSLPVTLLSRISLLLCKLDFSDDCSDEESLPIPVSCFDEAQNYVLSTLDNEFLHDFLQSTFYCKYCIELIENASRSLGIKLTIYDILYSEVTLFFFMEYLEQRHERDCLDFWIAAINFRKSYSCPENNLQIKNCNEAQSDAMIIYEKYFSLQCECRLWMSDKLRCKVEESICDLEKVAFCFDLPLYVTAKYLENKYLDNFLQSQLFQNYLNELKLKVHKEPSFGTLSTEYPHHIGSAIRSKISRYHKTMSDCTNEASQPLFKNISSRNTLLAMETQPHAQLKLQAATANLNIDSRQITNPKLLWNRHSSQEGLKFGRVNYLGRYERDFDVSNTLSSAHKTNWSLAIGSNKIKNAMRKLVNLPEDKVQEEIAWQVAEMIVKDVTNVTLCKGTMQFTD